MRVYTKPNRRGVSTSMSPVTYTVFWLWITFLGMAFVVWPYAIRIWLGVIWNLLLLWIAYLNYKRIVRRNRRQKHEHPSTH